MQFGLNGFHICAANGRVDIAEYLASKMGDHLYDTDLSGKTALHWAVLNNQLAMIKYLVLSCGLDVTAEDKV